MGSPREQCPHLRCSQTLESGKTYSLEVLLRMMGWATNRVIFTGKILPKGEFF
jgi:hypothetical protein